MPKNNNISYKSHFAEVLCSPEKRAEVWVA